MDTQPLNVKIDSGQARADLAQLDRALDLAGASAIKMGQSFTTGMGSVDKSIKGSIGSMEKFAQVSNLLSKIKLDGSGTKAITEFSKALSQLARTKEIEQSKLNSFRKFIEVGAQVSKLRLNGAGLESIKAFTQAVDTAARARAIQPAKMASWVKFIEVAARVSQLRLGTGFTANIKQFSEALDSIAKVRSITPARVASIKNLFDVLSSAKGLPNAAKIASDLDQIAAAAGRAGAAFKTLPSNLSGFTSKAAGVATSTANLNKNLKDTPQHAAKASTGFKSMFGALDGLGHRFNLTYQAGTLLSAFFASFTVGQFLKSVYDTNVTFQKLNKSMLFVTGSFKEAHDAVDQYIGISFRLGTNIEKNADAYGRFAISAGAAGLAIKDVNSIYEGATTALQAVGASSEQAGLAFYGLSQAMSKGKLSSEEFNRQIGEQIPGNAQAGAKALSVLTGKAETAATLFDAMRKGSIMSAPFLKEWAKQLQAMYAPLLPVAANRPDFQLNRLSGAFTLFKKAVGDSAFIGALVQEFKTLSDQLVTVGADGVPHLTKKAQELADTLGKGLAQVVHVIGIGLNFLANNIDKVVAALRGLAALAIVQTFNSWSKSASNFGDKMRGVGDYAEEAASRKADRQAARAASMQKSAAQRAAAQADRAARQARTGMSPSLLAARVQNIAADSSPATVGAARRASRADRTGRPMLTGQDQYFGGWSAGRAKRSFGYQQDLFPDRHSERQFGQRAARAPRTTTFDARPRPSLGSRAVSSIKNINYGQLANGLVDGFTALPGKLKPAFSVVRAGFNALPAILGVAGIALAIFGDKVTKLGKDAVSYNDIASGALSAAGRVTGEGLTDLLNGLMSLGQVANGSGGGKSLGEWLVTVSAGLITLGKVIFTFATSIGKILGTFLANTIVPWIEVMQKVQNKDYGGAIKQAAGQVFLGQGSKENRDRWAGAGKEIADDFRNAFDMQAVEREIRDGAVKASKGKGADQVAADAAAASQAQIEAALTQRTAADAQLQAARDMADAAESLKGEIEGPNADRSIARIDALINGSFVANSKSTPGFTDALRAPAGAATTTAASATGGSHSYAAIAQNANSTKPEDFAQRQVLTAAATMEDASKEASRNSDLADKIAKMPPAIALALTKAAKDTGFDPSVLMRMAARESDSKWSATSRNPASSAQGLFQITGTDTKGTYAGLAKKYGAFNRDDPYQSAVAAARLTKDDAAIVKQKTGVELTAGESYLTHFLGGNGASTLINARKNDPSQIAASVDGLGQAAASNRSVFYADKGKGRGYTVEELYGKLSRVNGGGGGGMSGGGAGGSEIDSEADADSSAKRQLTSWKGLQSLIGDGSPADAAMADYRKNMAALDQIITKEEVEAKKVGADFQTVFAPIRPQVIASIEKWQKSVDDALKPLDKEARLLKASNDILALRAAGQGREADWQEKLNALREQGYDVTSKNITNSRSELELQQDRTDALQAELKVTQALNDAHAERATRRGTALDTDIASQVANRANDWNTSFQDAQSRMGASGELDSVQQAAGVRDGARRGNVQEQFRQATLEAVDTNGLSASAKAYRDDYKTYLKDITGSNSDALKDIETAATDAEKKMATGYADLKKKLENPPGFQRWADSLEPLANRLEDIKGDFMEGLSQGITDALSGDKVDWRGMLNDLSKKALKAQVDEFLKGSLNLFGIGGKKGAAKLAATPEAQALITASDAQNTAASSLDTAGVKLSDVADKLGTLLDTAVSMASKPVDTTALANPADVSGVAAAQAAAVADPTNAINITPSSSTYSTGGTWDAADESIMQGDAASVAASGSSTLGTVANVAAAALGGRDGGANNPLVGGTDLGATGPTQDTTTPLGMVADAFGLPGLKRAETPVGGASAAGGNTAVTTGVGNITGPQPNSASNGAFTVASAQMTISSANLSPTDLTMSAQTVTLNAQSVTGAGAGGAGAGGAGASPLGGGGGGNPLANIAGPTGGGGGFDLSGFTQSNPVSVADSNLIPMTVDQTGGPGFRAAGTGMPDTSGMTPFGGGETGTPFDSMPSAASLAASEGDPLGNVLKKLGPIALALLSRKKKKKDPVYKDVNGVIGESRPVSVTGTALAGHSNIIADGLNMALSAYTGGFGKGGGTSFSQTFANMGSSMSGNNANFMSAFSKFEEGGYTTEPVGKTVMDMSAWQDAPHYKEGTANTTGGGIPAVVHPNEAVIPLSRGRSIPIDMPNGAMGNSTNNNVSSNITIIAPNPDAFRKSQGSIQRQQNRDMRRAATRNLTP